MNSDYGRVVTSSGKVAWPVLLNAVKIVPKEIDESLENVVPFPQIKMSKNHKKIILVNIDN